MAGLVKKVFNAPRTLNLPFANVPQQSVKTMENLTYITPNLNIEYHFKVQMT